MSLKKGGRPKGQSNKRKKYMVYVVDPISKKKGDIHFYISLNDIGKDLNMTYQQVHKILHNKNKYVEQFLKVEKIE